MNREILRVEALTVKPDGPFGLAGETATVTFSWRWDQGPLIASRYTTVAKNHGDSHGWRLYEDKLKHNLRVNFGGGMRRAAFALVVALSGQLRLRSQSPPHRTCSRGTWRATWQSGGGMP